MTRSALARPPAPLSSELARALSPAEEALGGCAPAAHKHNRFLCTVCLGTGRLLTNARRYGHVAKTCGQCKGTGQRGGTP